MLTIRRLFLTGLCALGLSLGHSGLAFGDTPPAGEQAPASPMIESSDSADPNAVQPVPDATGGIVEPVPVCCGNGYGSVYGYGWGAAYAPNYYYWAPSAQFVAAPGYIPGYSWGTVPGSWNGYWNYATAYGAPGYTGYWHGWYAGPLWADTVWYGWGRGHRRHNYWQAAYWGGYPAYGCGPACNDYGYGYGYGYANYSYGYTYAPVAWGHGHYHTRIRGCGLYGWW